MSDQNVTEAINESQQATLQPQIVLTSGAGKAYQSVAQSSALAIQDAVDNLRNINTIAATAIGVAMAQYLETADAKYLEVLVQAQTLMQAASQNFATVGDAASAVLKNFPSG